MDEIIINNILSSDSYNVGDYDYVVWPYKGISLININEVEYLAGKLASLIPDGTDALFSFMTDGELLTLPAAFAARKPFIICRDYHYNLPLPSRIAFEQRTHYFSREMYFRKPEARLNFCIVDAVISSGNTVLAAADAIKRAGSTVVGVITALTKVDYNGSRRINEELGLKPKSLFDIWRTSENKWNVKTSEK